MIDRQLYRHKDEAKALKTLRNSFKVRDHELFDYYKKFEEEAILPDLIGKTVEVSARQFPEVYGLVKDICTILEIKIPKIYVYESFYYDVNAEGLDQPWIKLSSKAITDLKTNELKFLLARQLCHIKERHIEFEVLCEQYSKLLMIAAGLGGQAASVVPMGSLSVGELSDVTATKFKLIACQWSRISEYTADNCGFLICQDIEASISAVKKTILNSSQLADAMNLSAYLAQSEEITKHKSVIGKMSIYDEQFPYGPFRIKELIRFASSKEAKFYLERTGR